MPCGNRVDALPIFCVGVNAGGGVGTESNRYLDSVILSGQYNGCWCLRHLTML